MAVLLAAPALACSPAEMVPSAKPVRGENCAVSHTVSEIDVAALGEVTKLSNGFLLQESFEGNACYAETSLLVIDCNKGQVALLGPQTFDLMNGGPQGQMEQLGRDLEKLSGKGKLSLDAAAKAGAKRKLPQFASAKTKDRIEMMGRKFALDCGCKTFYPDLKPGS